MSIAGISDSRIFCKFSILFIQNNWYNSKFSTSSTLNLIFMSVAHSYLNERFPDLLFVVFTNRIFLKKNVKTPNLEKNYNRGRCGLELQNVNVETILYQD